MTELGQKRRFEIGPTTSDLPRLSDIFRVRRHVSKVPTADSNRGLAQSTDSDSVSPLYHSSSARLSLGESRSAWPPEYQGVCEKSKAFTRLFAAASRLPRGAKSQRVSMNFKIEVVSYVVLSTKRRLA